MSAKTSKQISESTKPDDELSFADIMQQQESHWGVTQLHGPASGKDGKRLHGQSCDKAERRRWYPKVSAALLKDERRRQQPAVSAPPAADKNRNRDQSQHGYDYYKTDGYQNKKFQRLKQGKLKVAGRCDLHGCSAEQAKQQLSAFLNRQVSHDNKCVLIICGKGLHSSTREPVIKNLAMDFMRSHPEVIAYCPALQKDGGHGAFYVLMRRSYTIG